MRKKTRNKNIECMYISNSSTYPYWLYLLDLCDMVAYTRRNYPAKHQYERFLNSHEDFTRIEHDFTYILLS